MNFHLVVPIENEASQHLLHYGIAPRFSSFIIIPANTKRNKHVIITPKHRFNVMITCLLRFVFAGMLLSFVKDINNCIS